MPSLLDTTYVTAVVKAALQAPSGDNCQPWRFVWDGRQLAVQFVGARAESLYDVDHAASWIALGAALTNMHIAARHLGVQMVDQQLLLDNAAHETVVRLTLQPCAPVDQPLFPAIYTRCVNRRAYHATPLTSIMRDELLALASNTTGVRLDLAETSEHKTLLASLAAGNERLLFENRRLHDGLYQWLRWTSDETLRTGDGMPIASLELHAVERPGFRLLGSWPAARAAAATRLTHLLPLRTQQVYRRSAAIGLLSVSGGRPEDFVRGGELLQRLWLTAAMRGLAFQPITGMICLWWRCRRLHGEGLSPRHRQLVENAARVLERLFPEGMRQTPLMLFRVGYADAPTGRALRQPVDAVLTLGTS